METLQEEKLGRVGKICRAVSSIEAGIAELRAFVLDLVGDVGQARPIDRHPEERDPAPPLGVMLDDLPAELLKHAKSVEEIQALLAERLL